MGTVWTRSLFVVLYCSLFAGTVSADADNGVKMWRDEIGRVHFSDRPPTTGGAVDEVAVDPDHNVVDNPSPAPRIKPGKHQSKSTKSSGKANQARREAKKREERCARYKDQFEKLRDRMRRGYKASQYDTLMERERALEKKLREQCR